MIKVSRVKKVECETLEELESYLKEVKEIPGIVVINGFQFNRNKCYEGTCNEVFEYWKVNNYEPGELKYTFSITNGNCYADGKFDVNSYNFSKYEKLK